MAKVKDDKVGLWLVILMPVVIAGIAAVSAYFGGQIYP